MYIFWLSNTVRRPSSQVRRCRAQRGAAQSLGVCPEHAHHCGVLPRDRFQDLRRPDQIPPAVVPVQGKLSSSTPLHQSGRCKNKEFFIFF